MGPRYRKERENGFGIDHAPKIASILADSLIQRTSGSSGSPQPRYALASETVAAKLSLTSCVLINDTVLFQELQGEAVLFDLKTGIYLSLNKVGTRIWQLLGEHELLSKVVELMLSEYDVTEECCRKDLFDLIEKMREHGLVTVS